MESKFLATTTLARRFNRVAASIRTAVWRHGNWCGIKPVRLPNGRLLWPADEVDALAAGARADEAPDTGARLAAARDTKLAGGICGDKGGDN